MGLNSTHGFTELAHVCLLVETLILLLGVRKGIGWNGGSGCVDLGWNGGSSCEDLGWNGGSDCVDLGWNGGSSCVDLG